MARVQVFDENGAPVDLNQVQPWDGEGFSITPGDYSFIVTKAAREMSRQQKPQLALELEVLSGAATEAHNGAAMHHWISLTSKAASRLRGFMDAVGLEADADGGFDDQDCVGRQFTAEVYEDQYQKGVSPETGQPIMKTSSKIRKERPMEGAQEPATPQPAAPQPAALTASVRLPAPSKPTAPMLPRVASTLPRAGQRIPLPTVKR